MQLSNRTSKSSVYHSIIKVNSFFLIFITLFVALVMNYLHNQVLISKIDDEAWDFLNGVKNTKITDLKVGDYIVHEKHGIGIYLGIDNY